MSGKVINGVFVEDIPANALKSTGVINKEPSAFDAYYNGSTGIGASTHPGSNKSVVAMIVDNSKVNAPAYNKYSNHRFTEMDKDTQQQLNKALDNLKQQQAHNTTDLPSVFNGGTADTKSSKGFLNSAWEGTKDYFSGKSAKDIAKENGLEWNKLSNDNKIKLANTAENRPSAFSNTLGVGLQGLQMYAIYDNLFGAGKRMYNKQMTALDDQIKDFDYQYKKRKESDDAIQQAVADNFGGNNPFTETRE